MIRLGFANDILHYHLPGATRDPLNHPVRHLLPTESALTETDRSVIQESILLDDAMDRTVFLLDWCLRTRAALLRRGIQLNSLTVQVAGDWPVEIHSAGSFHDPEWMFSHAPFTMDIHQMDPEKVTVDILDEQGFSDVLGNWQRITQTMTLQRLAGLPDLLRQEDLSELRPLATDVDKVLRATRELSLLVEPRS